MLLAATTASLAVLTGFFTYAKVGYTHPPPRAWLLSALLMVVVIWVGLRIRIPAPRVSPSSAPGVWTLRVFAFVFTALFFACSMLLPHVVPLASLTSVLIAATAGVGLWQVRQWSARANWGPRHSLAVIMGIVAFFSLIFTPIAEFAPPRPPLRAGLVAVDVLMLLVLALLDRHLRRTQPRTV